MTVTCSHEDVLTGPGTCSPVRAFARALRVRLYGV
jgi:hypothetical protein